MLLRVSALPRLALLVGCLVFVAHFLVTVLDTHDASSYGGELEGDASWSEALGLDHYANWEAGVVHKFDQGYHRVREGLGYLKGGLWANSRLRLGSLYDVSTCIIAYMCNCD